MGITYQSVRKILLLMIIGLVIFTTHYKVGVSQAIESPWRDPVNLSQSGSSTDPILVVDSNNRYHVIWFDEFDKWVYTTGDGIEWSEPVPVEFPFGESKPKLFADGAGHILAFWIDQTGALLFSRAIGEVMGLGLNWSSPIPLAESASIFDLALDDSGALHLAYLRVLNAEGLPPGIYYRKSTDEGASWSAGKPLYTSAHMRSLTSKDASVDIATTALDGVQEIYVVFDNQPLKKILLARSKDGGTTWDELIPLDSPSPTEITSTPFFPRVNPNGREVLVVWGTEMQSGFDCTLLSQKSSDGGATWDKRQSLYTEISGCPLENQFFHQDNGQTILMSTIDEAVYLRASDGSSWSDPQPQPELFAFTSPETYNSVNFRCRQAAQSQGDELLVVGCDTVGSGDIWFRSRPMGSSSDWFPSPTNWSLPVETGTGVIEPATLSIQTDPQNNFHAIWIQANEEAVDPNQKEIYYMYHTDQGWSTPIPVLKSPEGDATQPASVIDKDNRIHVVWKTDKSEALYHSWAETARAYSPSEWAKPQLLPVPNTVVSSPSLLTDGTGKLYMVYAVPVNEGRGVYLITSEDGGNIWSTPQLLFDAGAVGWTMVDNPSLSISGDAMSLLFTRNMIGDGNPGIGLYYSRSSDNGQTWSALEQIDELPVLWSALESTGTAIVHRMWQVAERDVSSLWHEFSPDHGVSWSQATNFSRFGETSLAVSISSDPAGRLQLFQVIQDLDGKLLLKHWMWDGKEWITEQDLVLKNDEIIQGPSSLASAINADGSLSVLVSGMITSDLPDVERMYSTGQLIDLPLTVVSQDTSTQVITSSSEVTPTGEAIAVITQPVATQAQSSPTPVPSGSEGFQGRLPSLVLGVAISLIVIAAIAGAILYVVRQPGKGDHL